jgi:hypothetical protein
MDSIIDFLDGKKSYLTAIVTAIIGAVQALGYEIPQWIFAILGAVGLGTLRAAVSKSKPKTQ